MNRIEKICELLQQTPGDNFLRHALALEYIKIENDKDARILFESILKDSPDYIGSYYHLGKLLERNAEINLAVEWYEKGMMQAKALNDQHAYNELQAAYEDLVYWLILLQHKSPAFTGTEKFFNKFLLYITG